MEACGSGHTLEVMTRPAGADVLIAGGGVAALEAMLALRALAGETPHITILAPDPDFVVRATAVLEPFARGHARRIPLALIVSDHGAHLVPESLGEVDTERSVVVTAGGREIPYDTLLVALGTVAQPAFPGAITFAGPSESQALEDVLAGAVAGDVRSIAFVIPSGATWPLPAYELALLTRAHLHEHDAPDVRLVLVTPEERPLELFGEGASADLEARLEQQGIELHTLCRPREHGDGTLFLEGGATIAADRVIALPKLRGPAIPGLPHDDAGFIRVDEYGRVPGVAGVYAAGDCTAFPLKQGGLAAQQADAAATSIAAALGAGVEAEPFRPVLRGLLLTGEGPSYFRAYPGAERAPTTVAIDAPLTRRPSRTPSVATHQPLWWPPSKIAGRYLGAWLVQPHAPGGQVGWIEDRELPVSAQDEAAEEERRAALDLALMMADGEAAYGDWHAALRALDAAEALTGALPEDYAQKRDLWDAELRGSPGSRYAGS